MKKHRRSVLCDGTSLPYFIKREGGHPRLELAKKFAFSKVPPHLMMGATYSNNGATAPWPDVMEHVEQNKAWYAGIMEWLRRNESVLWNNMLRQKRLEADAFIDGRSQEKFVRAEMERRGPREHSGEVPRPDSEQGKPGETSSDWVRDQEEVNEACTHVLAYLHQIYDDRALSSQQIASAIGRSYRIVCLALIRLSQEGKVETVLQGGWREVREQQSEQGAEKPSSGGRERPEMEQDDNPRDLTVFSPFLRAVAGQQKAWSNSLRVAQESGKPHKYVLEVLRKLMSDLPPEIARPNFRPTTYTDSQGKTQPMIEFCQDVLSNVLAAVGGPKFHIVLYLLQQAFEQLLATVHSGGTGGIASGPDAATIAAAVTSAFAPVFRQQTEMMREGFALLRDQIANLGGGAPHVVRHDSMYDALNGSRVYDHDSRNKHHGGMKQKEAAGIIAKLIGYIEFDERDLRKWLEYKRFRFYNDRQRGVDVIMHIAPPDDGINRYGSWLAYMWHDNDHRGKLHWCVDDDGVKGLKAAWVEIKAWFESIRKKPRGKH
jgi:hypothetical protein